MSAPPWAIPFSDWPTDPAARAYGESLLYLVVPLLAAGVLVPFVLLVAACVCGCGRRRAAIRLLDSRWPAVLLSFGAAAAGGLAVWQSLTLLDATGELTGDLLAVVSDSQRFVCSASDDEPCNASTSLMGFAQQLESSTQASLGEVASYATLLQAGVAGLPPLAEQVAANLTSVVGLTSTFNSSLVSLAHDLKDLQRSMVTARELAMPYLDLGDQWALLQPEVDVPQVAPATLEQAAALQGELAEQGEAVQAAVNGPLSSGASQLEDELGSLCCAPGTELAQLNATVQEQAGAVLEPLADLHRALDQSHDDALNAWRGAGLPLTLSAGEQQGGHRNGAPPPPPSPLGAPALEYVVGAAVLLLLPALLLLLAAACRPRAAAATATAASSRAPAAEAERALLAAPPPEHPSAAAAAAAATPSKPPTRLCGCGVCCVVVAVPLCCAVAGLLLLLHTALDAACAPGAVDTALQANLAPLGNVSLGASLPPIDLAATVPAALRCGEPGGPSNGIELLGLAPVFDNAEAQARSFTAPFTADLAKFNESSIQPALAALSAAIEELPVVIEALNSTAQIFDGPGGAPLANATSLAEALLTMRSELPEGPPPGTPLQRWLFWYGAAAAPVPSAELQANNSKLRAQLAGAAEAAAAMPDALDACDGVAEQAPAAVGALGGSMVELQTETLWALGAGNGLIGAVTHATDGLGGAEAASSCGWAGRGYAAINSTLCEAVAPTLTPLWAALAAYATMLALCSMALICAGRGGAHASRATPGGGDDETFEASAVGSWQPPSLTPVAVTVVGSPTTMPRTPVGRTGCGGGSGGGGKGETATPSKAALPTGSESEEQWSAPPLYRDVSSIGSSMPPSSSIGPSSADASAMPVDALVTAQQHEADPADSTSAARRRLYPASLS